MMTDAETAWVAGLIEGEGYIGWTNRQAVIAVKMTDLDVLERLQSWTGFGRIHSLRYYEGRDDCKPQWTWRVGGRRDFIELARAIEPYMLARRGARIREVLTLAEEADAKNRARFRPREGTCNNGHDLMEVGVTTQNRCAECKREATRNHHAKRS